MPCEYSNRTKTDSFSPDVSERRADTEEKNIGVLHSTAQPLPCCDVSWPLRCFTWSEQTQSPCMFYWCGGGKLIKYKSGYRGRTCCKDQESDVFSQSRYLCFQKKKETEKRHKFCFLVMDVFTFDFATIRLTRLNFVSLWCTYISHKVQDDFYFPLKVLQAMKCVSQVWVGVHPRPL